MAKKKLPKDKQGKLFRMEVAHISPPEVSPNPPRLEAGRKGKVVIEANVLGFPAGTSVEFSVYEPFKLHEAAVGTATAQTRDEDRGVSAEWEFDYEAKKADIASTRFVVVGRVGRMVSISAPIEFVEQLTATLKDAAGDPLADCDVLLRAPGRPNIQARTDAEGKLEVDVPPGDYVIEVPNLVPAPPPAGN